MKKFPPYGKRIHTARLKGRHPHYINVLVGPGAWNEAGELAGIGRERDYRFVVLPSGDEAEGYRWSFVHGLDCCIHAYGGFDPDNLDRLCMELLRAGSSLVWCVPTGRHYRPVIGARSAA